MGGRGRHSDRVRIRGGDQSHRTPNSQSFPMDLRPTSLCFFFAPLRLCAFALIVFLFLLPVDLAAELFGAPQEVRVGRMAIKGGRERHRRLHVFTVTQ